MLGCFEKCADKVRTYARLTYNGHPFLTVLCMLLDSCYVNAENMNDDTTSNYEENTYISNDTNVTTKCATGYVILCLIITFTFGHGIIYGVKM